MNRWTKIAALGTWAAMTAYLGALIARTVVDCPTGDDFAFIDQIVGTEPVTLSWLWDAHNEHRMIVPKLVIVVVTRLAGIDFRAVAFVSWIALSGACLWVVINTARLRGRYAFEDTIIPIAVMTWAQSDALSWTSPFNLVSSTVLLLLWWGFAVRSSWRSLLGAAGCALCLAATGGNGVAALIGVVPWFAWSAWTRPVFRERLVSAVTAIVLVTYAIVYAVAYVRPGGHPAPAPIVYSVKYFVHLLASGFTSVPQLC